MPKRRQQPPPPETKPADGGVRVHYENSLQYRVIFAHGFMVGLNAQGDFHIAVWNEHPTYPTETELAFPPSGEIIEKRLVPTPHSVERLMEIGIVVPPQNIAPLIALLQTKLDEYQRRFGVKPNEEPSK